MQRIYILVLKLASGVYRKMIIGLKIRNFMKGEDEEAWLRIGNEAWKEFEGYTLATMEDMEMRKRDPSFDDVGMFIAELGGKPAGRVDAYVDNYREEKKGFIQKLSVIPRFRRRGVGRALVNKAIQSLRERGMETAESWVREDQTACKHLLESIGFGLLRMASIMKRDLSAVPFNIGENEEVKIVTVKKNTEDIQLLNWIHNEALGDLLALDFRPTVVEEVEHWLSDPDRDQGWFFALLEGKAVGFVGTSMGKSGKGDIDTLGVLKPYRRKGIGTALILRGMCSLKSKGMTKVELETDDTNPTRAIELYKKVGFKAFRKLLVYQKSI